jgi:serpin B
MGNVPRSAAGRTAVALLSICLLAGMAGCALLWPETPDLEDVAQSSLPRETDPDVATDDVEALVAGNSAFALDLLGELGSAAGNLFYSPYSISSALAMAYAGARGATESQMADVLHFTLDQQELHPAFNRIDLALNGRGEIGPPYEGEGFQLNVVNAAWGQRGYSFLRSYLDTLAVNYGSGLRLLDFAEDPEEAREAINDWVSDETNERIVDLLPPGSIDAFVRLVLTNAVYFNAPWLKPFDVDITAAGTFEPLDGGSVDVEMMRQIETFGYASWDGGQAVELPYNGETLSMVLFVPDRGTYGTFEADFDFDRYGEIVGSLEPRQVDLRLPKFEFAYDVSLVDPLKALGMTDAFTAADFSGIDGTHDLFISDVLHKAWVSVDEAGTEAAAATAVIVSLVSYPGPPVVLTINRPFLFVIRDVPTGTILFVGRVVDPAAD